MNIWERIDRDHVVIHASGRDVLQSHGDQPRRHNQFAVYKHEVLRHLAVVEDVVFPQLGNQEIVATLADEHKQIRKELKALDRKDKTGNWIEDFGALAQLFEATCQQHDGLEHAARATIDDATAERLGEDYEQAKIRRMEPQSPDWSRIGLGLGAAIGVAALGAAVASASRASPARRRSAIPLETDENLRLISSKKVEGTPVVGADGGKLGRIESFMVDKYSGRVAYAILSFGGHLGFGRSLFPLPWALLEYDEGEAGYRLAIGKAELAEAPRFKANEEPDFDAAFRRRIVVFYQPGATEPQVPSEPVVQREAEPA